MKPIRSAKIEVRGGMISIRGSFPVRRTSETKVVKQQRISTGFLACPENMERVMRIINERIVGHYFRHLEEIADTFHNEFLEVGTLEPESMIAKLEELLRMEGHADSTSIQHMRYAKDYVDFVGVPSVSSKITFWSTVDDWIVSRDKNTRSAQGRLTTAKKIAEANHLDDEDLREAIATKLHYIEPSQRTETLSQYLELDVIVGNHKKIPNLGWRNVYALMATYGIRNCEVFHADLTEIHDLNISEPKIYIPDVKTAAREIRCINPDLLNALVIDRSNLKLPKVDTRKSPQKLGQRVTAQFIRYGVEHNPYSLRHTWCVNLSMTGLPVVIAAKMAGHAPKTFFRDYHQTFRGEVEERLTDAHFHS